MEYNRRTFLETGALGMAAWGGSMAKFPLRGKAASGSSQGSPKDRPPAYPVIYNWDGAPHDYSEYPQSVEQFVEKAYAPMKDTQVGAHFWCTGEHEAKWPSKTMEMAGESQGRLYDTVRSMRHNEGIRELLRKGENPYAALVKRGHELGMHVYASIRMNDNHFSGLQLEDMAEASIEGLTPWRKQHPEWCLGPRQAPKWFAASWNFAIPQIREHRLQHITEVCKLADWDGVELDWQRHAFHLPLDDASRLSYILTDLQRALRSMTQRLGRERGRPFYLSVRVATTLEACRRIGYDLKTWVREDLCDMMAAGGGAGTDYGVEVEAFLDLLKGTGIRFYPGFDSGFWGAHQGLKPHRQWHEAMVRAAASGYWERGADGIYCFNWHANERTRRPLLTTVGSPRTLKGTDKVYATLHRYIGGWPFSEPKEGAWAGADLHDRLYGETPVALYRTLTEEGPRFHVGVYDDTVQEARDGNLKTAELQVELKHRSVSDKVEVSLDGAPLPEPQVRNVAAEDPDNPADVAEDSWLVWKLQPDQAARGTHVVQVRLLERDARLRPPLVVQSVEIHLNYLG